MVGESASISGLAPNSLHVGLDATKARSMFAGCFGDVLGHFCLNAIDAITPRHALSSRQIGEVDVPIKRAQLAGGNLNVNPNVIFAYCHAKGCSGAVLNGYV